MTHSVPRIAILAGALLAAQGASAQSSFLDDLFGRSRQPATTIAPPPSADPASPAGQGAAPAAPAAPRKARIPLPPKRPPSLGADAAQPAAPAAAAPALPGRPGPAVPIAANPSAPLNDREAVDRVNAFFNGFVAMSADFTQVSSNGQRVKGQLYIQKPGKLRFDYDKPSNLEIIADGSSVAIRDRRLNTQDLYPISQTPLKFLLNTNLDLARDLKLVDVSTTTEQIRVTVRDTTAFGGTSTVILVYNNKASLLNQWTVIDAQGTQTTVALSDVRFGRTVEPSLFRIETQRFR